MLNEFEIQELCKRIPFKEGHIVAIHKKFGSEEIQLSCQCSATWTHPVSHSADKILSIFESHLLYFDKPRMGVL